MKNKPLLILGFLSLAGCAGFLRELPIAPGQPTAEITIVRELRFFGGGITPTVMVDDQGVLALRPGEHATVRVPAGERLLTVSDGDPISAVVNGFREQLESGRRYFYMLEPSWGGVHLVPMTEARGERLVKETTERRPQPR
jgi:hypothetical protein